MKSLYIKIDSELLKKFKIKLIQDNSTQTEKIVEFIKNYVEPENKQKPQEPEINDAF